MEERIIAHLRLLATKHPAPLPIDREPPPDAGRAALQARLERVPLEQRHIDRLNNLRRGHRRFGTPLLLDLAVDGRLLGLHLIDRCAESPEYVRLTPLALRHAWDNLDRFALPVVKENARG